ncbi:DUF6701 domain-containing protein [Photobacterium sp. MCCC 1A19761]|uniref:DUF6701 domain-containing protein n=1 Tax=Photobacterium sp. MCCC 1A19761 TaxID=3115000 RepID=UPI00307E7633
MRKFYSLFLLVLTLLASGRVLALEFEFGQFTTETGCIERGCTIEFKNAGKYTKPPLVFLMPTFSEDNWRDAPSALHLLEVTTTKAVFRQHIAPYNQQSLTLKNEGQCGRDEDYCLEKVPMRSINYLVIEEGTIDLGQKGRILAASLKTSRYIQGGSNSTNHSRMAAITPPAGFSRPGLITQLQARNVDFSRPEHWVTATADQRENTFYVALDRSEVWVGHQGAFPTPKQTIGYLLVEGSGIYRGLEFSLGGDRTPDTLDSKWRGFDQITKPVQTQCQALFNMKDAYRFNEFPFIIASKNSRSGPDGGFLRLCRQVDTGSSKKISFVNDEDLNEPRRPYTRESCGGQTCLERKHADEAFGFIAFQQKVDSAVCEMFPGPAQTWKGNKTHRPHLYLATYGGDTSKFPQILNAAKVKGRRYVGFIPGMVEDYGRAGCNGSECIGDVHLRLPQQPALPDFPEPDAHRPVSDIIDGSTETLSHSANLGALVIQRGGKLLLRSGTYFIDSIRINNGGQIIVPAGNQVKLHTKWLSMSEAGSAISATQDTEDLVLYIHADPSDRPHGVHNYVALDQYAKIRGLVYSEKEVDLSNGAEITGAVTAIRLNMHNRTKITGDSLCIETQPEFEVSITPPQGQPLMCKAQQVDFHFQPRDGSGERYNGPLHVTLTGENNRPIQGQWSQQADGPWETFSGRTMSFTVPATGHQTSLWFKSDLPGKLNVEGRIDNMVGHPATGHYTFIPGGLELTPDTVNLVAGKPGTITMTVLACEGGAALASYHGDKVFDLATVNIAPVAAEASSHQIALKDTGQAIANPQWQTRQGTFYFNQGRAEGIPIRYLDAGQLKLRVKCVGESCGAAESGNTQSPQTDPTVGRLSGEVGLNSRPYTFALCRAGDHNVETATGTAQGGQGFVPAGEIFQVKARSVIWTEADRNKLDIDAQGNALRPVDSRGMCERALTSNFYAPSAPDATVLLNHALKTPDGGRKGDLSGTLSLSHDQLGEAFSASWNEVGSLTLQGDSGADYLGMDINRGFRDVGRFYPAYAEIQPDNLLTYPDGQQGFAYLGQPFDTEFTVLPKSVLGETVRNYALFTPGLQVTLGLEAVDQSGQSFGSRYHPPQPWRHWSGSPKTMQWLLERKDFDKRTTTKEAPWNAGNSRWGLYIADRVDPTGIRALDMKGGQAANVAVSGSPRTLEMAPFAQTPELRFGRMTLEDVTGRSDSAVTMPLRVEYWDGREFVVNSYDSASWFDGKHYCKQVVSQSAALDSTSRTQGAGNVSLGEAGSGRFSAMPHEARKGESAYYLEQVRFWQKLVNHQPEKVASTDQEIACETGFAGSQPQPWLLYNWRGKGDENPSALVTFGAYRGNDRVIYRGEKGINILLN